MSKAPFVSGTWVALLVMAAGFGQPALAGRVTFDVSLIEIKGSTDQVPAPGTDPGTLSAGYRYKAPGKADPNNPGKWEVSTYLFSPGAMTAVEGDEVSLRMFVVNGDVHSVWLEGPDGSAVRDVVKMHRGNEYSMTFTASKPGYYTLRCNEHAPTMSATILVLAKRIGG
jgi:plastocyanin